MFGGGQAHGHRRAVLHAVLHLPVRPGNFAIGGADYRPQHPKFPERPRASTMAIGRAGRRVWWTPKTGTFRPRHRHEEEDDQ